MLNTRLGRLALLGVLCLFVPAAPAQEEGASLREIKVQEILARCKGRSIAELWRSADELAKLGAPAKRAIQRGLDETSVEGRLAGLKALIALDSPTLAADRLLDLATDEGVDTSFRLAAIELIGLTEEEDAEDGLLELLNALDPQLRIAAARALWRLDSPQSHQAKTALRELLNSSDAELRAQGALALAEMGDGVTPGVQETLLELRKEPGVRGQLADALYRKLKLESVIQMREAREDASSSRRRASASWLHLDEIRTLLQRVYELEENIPEDVLRARAARGLLDFEDDPHTQFMTPEEYAEFLHGNAGVDPSYGGIGAFIDTNVKDRFRILRPIFGGPAWEADLRGGDDIVAVNGRPTAGRTNADIIKDVKGPPGTTVVLTIYREGWAEPREIPVIRAKIVLPTVFSRMLPGRIGYVLIAQFAYETGKELESQLGALEAEGMQGLVLDLRDNPGGLLGSVKECLTPFLRDRELICTLKGRAYGSDKHFSGASDRERGYPIAVLVNGRSASGAELMSGVLQYYSSLSGISTAEAPYLQAMVFGEATFGKGTVQHTMPLNSWPGEPFEDAPRKNGLWDGPDEALKDQNGNRVWDPGEEFEDRARFNRRWDEAEPWKDTNGNGRWDPGETYTDENRDGIWNPAEEFTDLNENGQYDHGAAVKLSVARYYLPGGRNFTRTRTFENGEYVFKGGVEPDIGVDNERMDVGHLVKLRELQEEGIFSDYVKSRWKEHRETFRKLAFFDACDPSRYPDFDAFYDSLQSRLTHQEVRRAIRIEVRREVANELGREIHGDLSDDAVLRRGVQFLLERLGVEQDSIPEYASLNGTKKTK